MLELNPEWFEARWRRSRSSAGTRYTSHLNVSLRIAAYFETSLQEPPIFDRFAQLAADLEGAHSYFTRVVPAELPAATAGRINSVATEVVRQLKSLADLRQRAPTLIPVQPAVKLTAKVMQLIAAPLVALRRRAADERREHRSSETERQLDAVNGLSTAFRQIIDDLDTPVMAACNNPYLLLLGAAGTGKTHLLCEMVRQRTDHGAPAILLLGQTFQTAFTDAAQTLTNALAPGEA